MVLFTFRSHRGQPMSTTAHTRAPRDIAGTASAYLMRARGDAVLALHEAIQDAMWERDLAQERQQRLEQAVSHGYVRATSARGQ